MLRPSRVTPPAAEPVSLSDLKSHLSIFHSDDDARLATLISGAVSDLDGFDGRLGRALVSQDWVQAFEEWTGRFVLPMPDISTATITYQDENDATQTVAADQYEIIETHRGAEVVFKDVFQEPSTYDDALAPISVTFTAGYGGASDVPQDIKIAIWLMVQMDYDQPEPQHATAIRHAIASKIDKHRWVTV